MKCLKYTFLNFVHDRIAAGETTVVSTATVLRCGKQMEKRPHYNFSWNVSIQNFGRGYGPVARQTNTWTWMYPVHFILLRCASRSGDDTYLYIHIFVGRRKQKRPGRGSRRRWDNNIKINQNVKMWTWFKQAQNCISGGHFWTQS
jgi:hypothetical protein